MDFKVALTTLFQLQRNSIYPFTFITCYIIPYPLTNLSHLSHFIQSSPIHSISCLLPSLMLCPIHSVSDTFTFTRPSYPHNIPEQIIFNKNLTGWRKLACWFAAGSSDFFLLHMTLEIYKSVNNIVVFLPGSGWSVWRPAEGTLPAFLFLAWKLDSVLFTAHPVSWADRMSFCWGCCPGNLRTPPGDNKHHSITPAGDVNNTWPLDNENPHTPGAKEHHHTSWFHEQYMGIR